MLPLREPGDLVRSSTGSARPVSCWLACQPRHLGVLPAARSTHPVAHRGDGLLLRRVEVVG